jgi:hypothetical protein
VTIGIEVAAALVIVAAPHGTFDPELRRRSAVPA